MIVLFQIIIIAVLLIILLFLYIEERQRRKASVPAGNVSQIWDGVDRRRFFRVNANIPVKYKPPKNSNHRNAINSTDISKGGIGIVVTEKLCPNERLALEIELPGAAQPIIACGKVVWIREDVKKESDIRQFVVGIEFDGISSRDSDLLHQFIQKLKAGNNGDTKAPQTR